MRDKTHLEQVERSARYVKNNPNKWKAELKPFIDGQIIMARRFYKNLAHTPQGNNKIIKLRLKK